MIQRKQTLYLIIVAILLTATYFLPSAVGVISSADKNFYEIYQVYPFGVYGTTEPTTLFSTTYLGVAISLCLLLTIIIITQFKKRWLQIRLSVFLMIFLLGVEAFMVGYGYKLINLLNENSDVINGFPMRIASVFPILAIFFTYLAFRAILKDELLIKSLNRMR